MVYTYGLHRCLNYHTNKWFSNRNVWTLPCKLQPTTVQLPPAASNLFLGRSGVKIPFVPLSIFGLGPPLNPFLLFSFHCFPQGESNRSCCFVCVWVSVLYNAPTSFEMSIIQEIPNINSPVIAWSPYRGHSGAEYALEELVVCGQTQGDGGKVELYALNILSSQQEKGKPTVVASLNTAYVPRDLVFQAFFLFCLVLLLLQTEHKGL